MKLTFREKRVIEAFEDRSILRLFELPPGASYNTMARLVSLGLVELVDPSLGEQSARLSWRLKEKNWAER